MNKNRIFIFLIIFIFLTGISMVIYPYLSQYLYEKNSTKVIDNYKNVTSKLSDEIITQELEKCYKYNNEILNNCMILTEPFDPASFPITEQKYEDLLNFDDVMANIQIPAINLNLPIYHGTSEEVLKKGVGHLETTSLPVGGNGTHAALSAHRGLASAKLFTDLNKLKNGDKIILNVLNKTLVYKVFNIEIVNPDNVDSIKAVQNQDILTLITCTPYGINTQRLLVHAIRTDDLNISNNINNNEIHNYFNVQNLIMLLLILLFIIIFILTCIKVDNRTKINNRFKKNNSKKINMKGKHFSKNE